jgi:hypothetical protein
MVVNIEHLNARNWWTTSEVSNNRVRCVLIVETDLVTDAHEAGFDVVRYFELMDAIINAMVSNPEINRMAIRKIYSN